MNKTLIFLFFTLIVQLLFAQHTSIPDPAFENYLKNNGMGDGISGNGQVLTANIENVTHLDLPSFADISDMTGIEDFTSVEFLDFSYNTVANINLSQNVNLEIFGCAFNQITSLDLSNNTHLTWVVCQNNSISDIQLNSPVLHTLECYENQLISLDLSQCPALETIDCHINNINNLNISECAELIHLTAWDNQLTDLDLSNNTNLINLHISRNNFIYIDTSYNMLLEGFICSYTNLESVDLSSNTNLISVSCSYNQDLVSMDIRNGNNGIINSFFAFDENLDCIYVDHAVATYLDNWNISETTTFVNNEQECEELSISSIEGNNAIKIYPNPVTEYIVISLEHDSAYELFEMNGKRINFGFFNKGLNSLNVSELTRGIYLLKFKFDNSTLIKKIVKN